MSLSCVALCYAEFSDVHLLLAICYYDGFYNEFLIQQKEYALLASSNGKIYCPSGRKSTFHDDFAFITGMIFGNVLLILLFFVYDLPLFCLAQCSVSLSDETNFTLFFTPFTHFIAICR